MRSRMLPWFVVCALLGVADAGCDEAEAPAVTMRGGSGAVLGQEIHLERGMHCIDCHFLQDSHGDGNLYARNVDTLACGDCHEAAPAPAPPPKDPVVTDNGPCTSCHNQGLGGLFLHDEPQATFDE